MSDYGSVSTYFHHDYKSGADIYTTYDKDNNIVYSGSSKEKADLERHKLQKQYIEAYKASDEYQQWKKENQEAAAAEEARDQAQYKEWGIADETNSNDSPGSSNSAPPFESSDDSSDISDSKIESLLTGEPTNTMSTGNPKEYKTTDAKEDSSKSQEENKTESSSKSQKENKTESSSKSQNLNVKGAMSIVGAGVSVAALAANAGGIKNAAEDIAVAAAGAIASKAGEIIGEYSTKFVTLPLSIPTRIVKYTNERIAKSKGDKDENGNEYDPVKVSLGDIMCKFTESSEEQMDKKAEDLEEKNKNKTVDNAKQKAQKYIESANKLVEKSNKSISKIIEHIGEGAEWVQNNLNKEYERAEKNIKDGLEEGYKNIEKDIDKFSKNEGDKIAVKIIKKYNKTIEEQAKDIVDKKNKAKSKATIKGKAAVQKAKLKLFALIGL